MPKKIPCHIIKVTKGVYVTPNPTRFCFIRKHHNHTNFKNIFLLSHICFYTSNKWINTKKKDTLPFIKLLLAFLSPPPPPPRYCNILTNKKNLVYKIYFCSHIYCMLLNVRKIDLHPKKVTLPNICHPPTPSGFQYLKS